MSQYKIIFNPFTGKLQYVSSALTVDWDSIQNGPNSTPAEIDTAVSQATVSITSVPSGDWKKITSMEYNPTLDEVRVSYES